MDMETFVDLAENAGVKIEMSAGIPTWEAFPSSRHQVTVQNIYLKLQAQAQQNTTKPCGCHTLLDTYIRLPDGSLKRPDIAIFCEEPPLVDEALEMLPGAVVEVISKGYEAKDTQINPPLYLANGVLDVILVDPRTGHVAHHRHDGVTEHTSPLTIALECGCEVSV